MKSHDSMVQYVTDRAPHLAPPRTTPRPDWTAAAVATEGRRVGVDTANRPIAPIFHISEARIARALADRWGPAPTPRTDAEYAEMAWGPKE